MYGKVVQLELCKKLECHRTTKYYMLKSESVLEKETHKILRNFEIQTDPLIPARRPDLEIIIKNKKNKKKKVKKRTCRIVDFAVQADHRVKIKETEKRDKNLDLSRELKKKIYGI